MQLFEFQASTPRWFSFENPNGEKGAGGKSNRGAKGAPCGRIPSGETLTLCDMKGQGLIRRFWITFPDRAVEKLEKIRIRMRWEDAPGWAVDAPLAEFCSMGRWGMRTMENTFFASPEGRSFVCTIPMPFRKHAQLYLYNGADAEMKDFFYDVDLTLEAVPEDALYFHTQYACTQGNPGTDHTLLDISGKGRLLGTCISVQQEAATQGIWFGEGEVKMYLDGEDTPTLVGTGTEDYIGSAWGQGEFIGQYTGCTCIREDKAAFYRFHVQDPIFFQKGIKAIIQRMGGGPQELVEQALGRGAQILPVTCSSNAKLWELGLGIEATQPGDWVNYYSSDTFTSCTYYYHQKP